MPDTLLKRSVVFFLWCFLGGQASAQSPVGVRAAGMGDAFVAVADDASAVYWNPAGLATGAFVSFVVDTGDARSLPEDALSPDAAFTHRTRLVALALPPLGFSYYRLAAVVASPQGTAVPALPDREEGRRNVRTVATSQFGATLVQSISEYVVVGATVKLVRGAVASGVVPIVEAEAALDAARDLPTRTTTRADVDLGAMMSVEHLRLGVVARNLTTPSFAAGEGQAAVELKRQVRAGAAWGSGWPGISRLIVSADADLSRQDTPTGERRDVAAGMETWWLAQRLGVRAGVRSSTVGDRRVVAAAGASVALKPSVFLDGHIARGAGDARSWSVGTRVSF